METPLPYHHYHDRLEQDIIHEIAVQTKGVTTAPRSTKQLQCCNGEDDTAFLRTIEIIKRKDMESIDCNYAPCYGVNQSSLSKFILKASETFNVLLYEKIRHEDRCHPKDGYSMFSSHHVDLGGDNRFHAQDRKLLHITSVDCQV